TKIHPVKHSLNFFLGLTTSLLSINFEPLQRLDRPSFNLSETSFKSSSTSFFHCSTLFPSFISTFSDNVLGYRCSYTPSFLCLICILFPPHLNVFVIVSRVYRYTSSKIPLIPYAFCINIHSL